MKSINILLLAITLVAGQACSPKAETDEKTAETEAATKVTTTAEERHEAFEKKRIALEEKRKLIQEERIKASMTYTDKDGHLVYNKAEENPSFNGGDRAMKTFLRENVKFPKDAESEGLDGTVYVDFVVSSDGNVREVGSTNIPNEVVDPRFVNEAIRVVKSMPRWLPGRQHGKAVDVSYTIPITFEIAS